MSLAEIDLDHLQRIGLTPALANRARTAAEPFDEPLALARITAVHRETVELADGRHGLVATPPVGPGSTRAARLRPRLAQALADAGAPLAVGDWALAARDVHGDAWLVARVPPSTHLVRRDGDGTRHAVVSNVDLVVVVMGCEDDFNLRRVERYLAVAHASGVAAAVVLTKADVVGADVAAARAEAVHLRLSAPRLPVLIVDATAATAAETLAPLLTPGRTLVLLGSSGAGKSTLTNTLLGRPAQDTGAVRAHDGRGMHTTTARSLHLLPGGACIIDTPGIRTIRADVDEATLQASFGDVAERALRCRFRDCSHDGEPGCAVQAEVDPDRLRNFQKLVRETRRDNLSWVDRRQQLAAWKSRGKAARLRLKMKRGEV